MVIETSVYSPFNHLTRLQAREYFIETVGRFDTIINLRVSLMLN
jgi:hypothetical protein